MPHQPHETIWSLATATVRSRTLQVIADLGVADHVGDSPVNVEELALACEADADALERALRLLAAHGIFERNGAGFAHTEGSRLLRSDHPMSMRAFARMMGMASFTTSFSQLGHAVRTGTPALEIIAPDGLFAHLQRHPEEASIFDEAMTAKAAGDLGAVLGTYDFTRFTTIADIGGGRGHLLRAVLEAAPEATGLLFDLPAVVDSLDMDVERLALRSGDFFVDPLPAADVYVLMEVIHDWGDAQAVAILSAVRRAAPSGATVVIIEGFADDERLDPVVQTLDMIMLTITGGRERTVAQVGRLLGDSGLRLTRHLETPGALGIVEAVPV